MSDPSNPSGEPKVVVTRNGCYLVSGGIPLTRQTIGTDSAGESEKWSEGETFPTKESYALCRCGRSSTKPFCDPHGKVWNQVTGTQDPQVRANFIRQVGNCPSGRLVAWERASGAAIEPDLQKSIGVIEDPAERVSGPLWLRGGIPVIAADGFAYEVRNRVTLCRCGASANKPFCDGSHVKVGFRDWE